MCGWMYKDVPHNMYTQVGTPNQHTGTIRASACYVIWHHGAAMQLICVLETLPSRIHPHDLSALLALP